MLRHLFWFTRQLIRISWTCGTGNELCKFRQKIKWVGLENCRINNIRLKCRLRSTYSCKVTIYESKTRKGYSLEIKDKERLQFTNQRQGKVTIYQKKTWMELPNQRNGKGAIDQLETTKQTNNSLIHYRPLPIEAQPLWCQLTLLFFDVLK